MIIVARCRSLKKAPSPSIVSSSLIRQSSSRVYSPLKDPTVIYSDNHLLVVNKPPGWHSVPNPDFSPKCILSRLKNLHLGGGSKRDFLLPLHRIDQPCSGLLMLGKTSKAASRITKLWKKKSVEKHYLVVVPSQRLMDLRQKSMALENSWFTLKGILQSRKLKDQRSVAIRPVPKSLPDDGRLVSVDCKMVQTNPIDNPYAVVLVRTSEGARHMIRALLAQVGMCPIEGDLRYNSTAMTLSDQSVALHAYRIILDDRLQLGSLKTHEFVAPIPPTWGRFFGILPEHIVEDRTLSS